jgi:hypothetical protein
MTLIWFGLMNRGAYCVVREPAGTRFPLVGKYGKMLEKNGLRVSIMV